MSDESSFMLPAVCAPDLGARWRDAKFICWARHDGASAITVSPSVKPHVFCFASLRGHFNAHAIEAFVRVVLRSLR